VVQLALHGRSIEFERVPLVLSGGAYADVFSLKNNKTVSETLEHPRYRKFQALIDSKYAAFKDSKLGEFLLGLKRSGNRDYKLFLNKYGDLTYCTFGLNGDPRVHSRGIYTYLVDDTLRYVGRCRDEFSKRVNQGYGKIHPKNCYLDGQATNCRLNNLVALEIGKDIAFYVHVMEDENKIVQLERELIQAYNPPWNASLRGR
jgi:hypothetical protein